MNMKRYSFLCHRCGKCCKSSFAGLTLTFDEVYEFREDFPIFLYLHVEKVTSEMAKWAAQSTDEPMEPRRFFFPDGSATLVDKKPLGSVVACGAGFFLDFGFFVGMAGKRCPMLGKDGNCSLHVRGDGHLPVSCRAVPLNFNYNISDSRWNLDLDAELDFFIREGCVKVDDGTAHLADGFTPFFMNGRFVDESPLVSAMREEDSLFIKDRSDGFFLGNIWKACISDDFFDNLASQMSNQDYGTGVSVTLSLPDFLLYLVSLAEDGVMERTGMVPKARILRGDRHDIIEFLSVQRKILWNLLRKNIPRDRVAEVSTCLDATTRALRSLQEGNGV